MYIVGLFCHRKEYCGWILVYLMIILMCLFLKVCMMSCRSHVCRRSGSSGGRRSGSGMSMGGTATSGSNTSVSGTLVVSGRTGSQERGAWVGLDSALHLVHSHGLHLPQGSSQPYLPHQEDSKRKSRLDYSFNNH